MVARPPRRRPLTPRDLVQRLRDLERHVTVERVGYALILGTALAIAWALTTIG